MIKIDVPGWENMEIENIVLDLNGTIATDGEILPEVKQRVESLSEGVKIYVLTGDTYGTANDEIRDMKAELVKIAGEDTQKGKLYFLKSLDLEKTVAIGNGNSDLLILKEACLGIAVLGDEGIFTSTMKNSDLVVKNIYDALDLFLNPKRLIATLRQ
jgi:soluble P-type ATPase